jgi:hypothetical protein
MAAEFAGDPSMDLTAPDGSGVGDAAWAAVHAAQLAMPSFAADVVWFADDPVMDSTADPDPPSALAPVSEIVVGFAALPETGPVDVADLLSGFGHAPPDEADLPGADEFALLAAWPMPPPDGVETEPWPG